MTSLDVAEHLATPEEMAAYLEASSREGAGDLEVPALEEPAS